MCCNSEINRSCNAPKSGWFKQPFQDIVITQKGEMFILLGRKILMLVVSQTGWFPTLHNFWAAGIEANSRIWQYISYCYISLPVEPSHSNFYLSGPNTNVLSLDRWVGELDLVFCFKTNVSHFGLWYTCKCFFHQTLLGPSEFSHFKYSLLKISWYLHDFGHVIQWGCHTSTVLSIYKTV